MIFKKIIRTDTFKTKDDLTNLLKVKFKENDTVCLLNSQIENYSFIKNNAIDTLIYNERNKDYSKTLNELDIDFDNYEYSFTKEKIDYSLNIEEGLLITSLYSTERIESKVIELERLFSAKTIKEWSEYLTNKIIKEMEDTINQELNDIEKDILFQYNLESYMNYIFYSIDDKRDIISNIDIIQKDYNSLKMIIMQIIVKDIFEDKDVIFSILETDDNANIYINKITKTKK